jgi:hypothetical protein
LTKTNIGENVEKYSVALMLLAVGAHGSNKILKCCHKSAVPTISSAALNPGYMI